jgi:competence protein ComEA
MEDARMHCAIKWGVTLSLAAALAFLPAQVWAGITGVVNVNTANSEQLQLLPNVGGARAQAIVEHRKAHGPFKSVSELTQVSGIGDKALESMRKHCVLEGRTTARREEN